MVVEPKAIACFFFLFLLFFVLLIYLLQVANKRRILKVSLAGSQMLFNTFGKEKLHRGYRVYVLAFNRGDTDTHSLPTFEAIMRLFGNRHLVKAGLLIFLTDATAIPRIRQVCHSAYRGVC